MRPRSLAALVLVALPLALAAQESPGTIKPFRKQTTLKAVVESTWRFLPQIVEVYNPQEQEAAENLPPPVPVRPASEGNTLPVGSVLPNQIGAPGSMFPGISATGWNPPDPHIAV